MRTARSAQRFPCAAVGTSERAKFSRKFTLEFGPSLGKIRILIKVGQQCNVICLADVSGSGIRFAVRRMITQWFHLQLGARVDHDRIIVSACCIDPNSLELVNSSVNTIFIIQFSLKWVIRLVRGSFGTHDETFCIYVIPSMRTRICAQGDRCAAMGTREGTKLFGELLFELRPAAREIAIRVAMGRVRHVIVLPDVYSPEIGFTIRRMIA